jgi:hypothetical protein
VRRILDTRWPALLVGSACVGIALSVWLRPPAALPALVAFSAVVGALLASHRRRLAFAGVALACAGLWWGTIRGDALDRSFLAGRLGHEASARVVTTGPARRTSFALRVPAEALRVGPTNMRERVLLELPPERAPPQGAVLELRARPVAALMGDPDRFERSVLRLALALLVVLRLLVVLLLRARVTESCFGAHRAIKRRSITSFDRDRAPLRGGSGGAKREGARQAGPLLSNAVRSS